MYRWNINARMTGRTMAIDTEAVMKSQKICSVVVRASYPSSEPISPPGGRECTSWVSDVKRFFRLRMLRRDVRHTFRFSSLIILPKIAIGPIIKD